MSFISDYNVKIVEQVYALKKEHENYQLFSKEVIRKYREKKYIQFCSYRIDPSWLNL